MLEKKWITDLRRSFCDNIASKQNKPSLNFHTFTHETIDMRSYILINHLGKSRLLAASFGNRTIPSPSYVSSYRVHLHSILLTSIIDNSELDVKSMRARDIYDPRDMDSPRVESAPFLSPGSMKCHRCVDGAFPTTILQEITILQNFLL